MKKPMEERNPKLSDNNMQANAMEKLKSLTGCDMRHPCDAALYTPVSACGKRLKRKKAYYRFSYAFNTQWM